MLAMRVHGRRLRGVLTASCVLGGSLLAQGPPSVPQALAALADQPATHTSFRFDRGMLEEARALIDPNQTDVRRVAAALTSISVDTYRYPQAAFYAPETMGTIIAAYNAAGWKHLVDQNAGPGQSAQPTRALTDLWLHYHGLEIDDVTVLVRSPRDMNLIQISCMLRPLDLLHLSGHFGIPKVDPDAVMVPAGPGR
ncbi:MAG: hypothetical protein NVSMB3_09640 [Acidobacteriaceae bacterium]